MKGTMVTGFIDSKFRHMIRIATLVSAFNLFQEIIRSGRGKTTSPSVDTIDVTIDTDGHNFHRAGHYINKNIIH